MRLLDVLIPLQTAMYEFPTLNSEFFYSITPRQDFHPISSHGKGMLELSGEFAVFGNSSPPVIKHLSFPSAFINHRLNRENHS